MKKCVHCGKESDKEMCDSCYDEWVNAWKN